MLRKWSTFVFLLLVTPMLALAQNTGKVAGTVLDAETGESLPGASVVVVGTQLGTISNVDGAYFIIGVPVGRYDVQASFVGYQTETVTGVDVSSGYTQEINFTLSPGVELDEIIVEYERPLIQKDAIGVPKIVTAEEIVNLPVRGAANVAKIQAGVTSADGSGTLNVRGGRGDEVQYFIDGVKVIGSSAVPQSAVQEQEMMIGNISARYGDAMSGIINITTKSGSPKFFGSIEGITSEALDAFGYNLISGAIGGPVVGEKVGFFLSAEYNDQKDSNPRWAEQLRVTDQQLQTLEEFPIAFTALGTGGTNVYIPVPGTLADGAQLVVDDNGRPIVSDGYLSFTDGTVAEIPAALSDRIGSDIDFITSLDPIESAAVLTKEDFQSKKDKRSEGNKRLSLDGNLNFNLVESVRLRVGGRYITSENENSLWLASDAREALFTPSSYLLQDRTDWQAYATWTHYLSNSTFYQLQFDYTNRDGKNYDPRMGDNLNDLIHYGDVDFLNRSSGSDVFSVLRGYKDFSLVDETRTDADGEEFVVKVPTYVNRWSDGRFPLSETVATLVAPPGGYNTSYFQFETQQLRFQATATTQLGLHQLEFGGEFEQRTQRSWSIGSGNASALAQWYNDGDAEAISNDDPNPEGYNNYADLPNQPFENRVTYYGYNYLGNKTTNTQDLDAFTADCDSGRQPDGSIASGSCYDVAPWKPLYYGGYIQDKIEFRDIVLNLGLRVDVFDNNTVQLFDNYARLEIVRAGDQGVNLASGPIGQDFSVYYNGNDVVGFRDLDANFYDVNGQQVQAAEVVLNGKQRQREGVSNTVTSGVFKDYEPQVSWMPRIGVSFPVTDQALFFARYGIITQRPSVNNFSSLSALARTTGRINQNGLLPEQVTEYELGFRQRLGARSAITISGFFRQIQNLIQLDDLRESFPNGYSTFANKDYGTVQGFEFGYDMRRTNGLALNFNYTLSFAAAGTGSSSTTTSNAVWIDETPPNFISPLAYDQRHKLNLSLDYRLGKGEGPKLGNTAFLEQFGFNILAIAGSGFPYTPTVEPISQIESKAPIPTGGINAERMPWYSRVDLRIDRRFPLGARSNLSAFLWIENLLGNRRVQNVFDATGLSDDDGYLATVGGQQFLDGQASAAESLYRHRNRRLSYVGLPRLIRLGLRFDF